jgi:uncharacterized protein (TIGR03663 family)
LDRAPEEASARDNGDRRPGWSRSQWLTAGVILLIAVIFRVALLDIKPAHFDEGVNGWFVDQMTSQGFYHYDPGNFHGPLHFYALFVSQTLFGRDIWALRLPIVLVSIACVALVLAFQDHFGRRACELAALAMAISPGMIFYGRYSIHETWLLLFLLLTALGLVELWRTGSVRGLWCGGLGVTGMVLTKETYAIHLLAMGLALPALWILELRSPSAPLPLAVQRWSRRDLLAVAGTSLGLLIFFYTGAFLDWPDFSREAGTVGSLAGLWETFGIWANTGTAGETGHEKPWAYWLELLVRYEWPAAAGLLATSAMLLKNQPRDLRYLAIAGVGTLTGYSIIEYKTPWCLIVMMWPFLFVLGHVTVRAARSIDRVTTWGTVLTLFGMSAVIAWQLNFRKFTDENEPYVYVQTLPDVNKLVEPLHALARVSPEYYHLRGNILLPENDSHPLSWLLGDFTGVQFWGEAIPPDGTDADFLVVEDALVADVEERLTERYFRAPFILRGGWGNSATLYLRAGMFAPLFPDRAPDFVPNLTEFSPAPEAATPE